MTYTHSPKQSISFERHFNVTVQCNKNDNKNKHHQNFRKQHEPKSPFKGPNFTIII